MQMYCRGNIVHSSSFYIRTVIGALQIVMTQLDRSTSFGTFHFPSYESVVVNNFLRR